MITNQEVASRDDEALPKAGEDSGLAPVPEENRANPTEQVIAAFAAAARGGAGPRESAFDVAVRAYIACYPETCWEVAARIVADIISHQGT